MRPSTQGMTAGLVVSILAIVALVALVWLAFLAPATNG
jgi:hypothetical protein